MWVIYNPSLSAVGCPHPRPNPGEGRNDLQIAGHQFTVFTDEEIKEWRLSPGFVQMEREGLILVEETGEMPSPRPELPPEAKPENDLDAHMAFEVALSPDHRTQMQRINLFREDEETERRTGRVWQERATATEYKYLRSRHLSLLRAAQWYLENYVEKRDRDQNERLRAIKARIKDISKLV